MLDTDYATYLGTMMDGVVKANRLAVGQQAAAAVVAWRANDGRDNTPPSPTSTHQRLSTITRIPQFRSWEFPTPSG
jgi:hypothetical protein